MGKKIISSAQKLYFVFKSLNCVRLKVHSKIHIAKWHFLNPLSPMSHFVIFSPSLCPTIPSTKAKTFTHRYPLIDKPYEW